MMNSGPPTSVQRPIRWRKALPVWLQVVVLLFVFGSGVGVGAVAASRYLLARMQHYRAHPEVLPGEITQTLSSRLGLTDQQTQAVRAVISHRHGRIEAIRRASSPEIHAEFDRMEQEVAAILDARQKQKWFATADWVRKSFLPFLPKTLGSE